MKLRIMYVVAITTIALASSGAWAGGGDCASKKGHKGMSADGGKHFKDGHSLTFEFNKHSTEKNQSIIDEEDTDKPMLKQPSSPMIGA